MFLLQVVVCHRVREILPGRGTQGPEPPLLRRRADFSSRLILQVLGGAHSVSQGRFCPQFPVVRVAKGFEYFAWAKTAFVVAKIFLIRVPQAGFPSCPRNKAGGGSTSCAGVMIKFVDSDFKTFNFT
jgi:hypothetical protein